MGLLTKVNSSQLKSAATDFISSKPENLNNITWGLLGNFAFGIYSWIDQFQMSSENEFVTYPNLGGKPKKELAYEKNNTATLSFSIFQRDLNNETQTDEQIFEDDILETLNMIYDLKKSKDPLPLIRNNGEYLVDYFSIQKVEWSETDVDSKGMPWAIQINSELEGYSETQVTK